MDGGLLDTTIFHGAHLGTHHSCTHASALKPPSPAAHGHVEILRVACAFIVRHEFASRRCDRSASCVCVTPFASYTLVRYVTVHLLYSSMLGCLAHVALSTLGL